MFVDRNGTFDAYPLEIGVDETGPNNLVTVVIKYGLVAEHQSGGEPVDISREMLEITGYHYIERKDHTLNTHAIEALKAAFGWDGLDPAWFQTEDLSQKPVTVVIDYEAYNGQDRLKLKWLNPYGVKGGGGVARADDSKLKAISNRLGAKLRAVSGAPVATPKPAGKPTPPAARPVPAKPAAPVATAPVATQDGVWEAFCKLSGITDETEREARWFEILGRVAGDTPTGQITPAQWAEIDAQITGEYCPY